MTDVITDIDELVIKFKDGRVAHLKAEGHEIGITIAPQELTPEYAIKAVQDDIEALVNGYLFNASMAGIEAESVFQWLDTLTAELRHEFE